MRGKSPRITADEVIRVLERAGYKLSRQSGSHRIYKNPLGKRATVPYHKGRILHPKVLASILRDAELTREEFAQLLEDK
ncbi:MAG: type II toxin-antitoxin system HicA family toxin [Chloroflexi bacterium]|nr:type II toxin-antitoxin system HicA family toxin [Chloroflexota bacterium]